MNQKWKLTYWQTSLFKLSCIGFGLLLGIYFQETFAKYLSLIWIVTLLSGLYIASVWFKQK